MEYTNTDYIIAMIVICLLVWIPWLWRYRIKPFMERKSIWAQLSERADKERFQKTFNLLAEVYSQVNTSKVSHEERKRLSIQEDAYIYGEIDFLSFMLILDKIQPQAGEVFCDLGSGAGKAVLAAALNYDLSRAVGIEFLPGLCDLANAAISKAKEIINSNYKSFAETYLRRLSAIEIINDDLFKFDLRPCNIVFINATCFNHPMWDKIQEKLNTLKPGSRVIVTSKSIDHKNLNFILLSESNELMSWGMNSLRIYQKIT